MCLQEAFVEGAELGGGGQHAGGAHLSASFGGKALASTPLRLLLRVRGFNGMSSPSIIFGRTLSKSWRSWAFSAVARAQTTTARCSSCRSKHLPTASGGSWVSSVFSSLSLSHRGEKNNCLFRTRVLARQYLVCGRTRLLQLPGLGHGSSFTPTGATFCKDCCFCQVRVL